MRPRRVSSNYLLSGLLRCQACGQAMSGHSAKSGKFFYSRCINASKRGYLECPGHWIPKEKIEACVIEKIKSHILTDENLLELVDITKEELDSESKQYQDRLKSFEKQTEEIESRLERLYDALEQGSFSSDELAPEFEILRRERRT